MPTTINIGKPLEFNILGGIENNRVVIFNRNTGESRCTDDKGIVLRRSDTGRLTFDAEWFSSGWSVGDVVECIVTGKSYGSATVTLTAATGTIQRTDVTVATAGLSTGGL